MEYLDNIILFISCIFEIYIYHDFFRAYFDFKNSNQMMWKRIGLGLLAVISLFIVNTYGNSYINLFGFIIIVWLYCLVVFQTNLGTRILYFLIAFFVGSGCEFLFGTLSGTSAYMENQNSVICLSDIPWQIFTMKLLTFVLFAIIKQFFGLSKKTMDVKIFMYYMCIPIASIVIMLLTYYSGLDFSVEMKTKVLLCTSFVLMLFGNIFIFHAFNRYSEELYVNAEQKLIISRQAMDLQYYDQVQKLDNQYQEFIHNIAHHLKAIGELAKENKNSNIVSILQDLNIELENNVSTIYCDNPVINAILSEKRSVAENNNLNLDIYIEPGVVLSGISDADIITILSNLFDNALRAAKDADNKSIIIRIYSENDGYFNILKVKNYFAGEVITTASGFVSTKEEQGIHGIGIKSVENTAEKYNGYLECFVEEQLFTAVLVLPTP